MSSHLSQGTNFRFSKRIYLATTVFLLVVVHLIIVGKLSLDEYIVASKDDNNVHSVIIQLNSSEIFWSSSRTRNDDIPPVWDAEIIPEDEKERCDRYGFGYDGRLNRRRIFAGGLISDESWHVIKTVATEAYGVYEVFAFVESNFTQTKTQRTLRFAPNSTNLNRLQGGMFGPGTKVTVDIADYLVDTVPYDTLESEMTYRAEILKRWKKSGMTPDDIGIITDTDETFTRDFLRAAQICDVPEFRQGQNCKRPKVVAMSMVFESSPDCIRQDRRWHHPDAVIGECLEGIGNATGRPKAVRDVNATLGKFFRAEGYQGGYEKAKHWKLFPLLNAADFRICDCGTVHDLIGDYKWEEVQKETNQPLQYTGYHFHNFFGSAKQVRNKYATYGHPVWGAKELSLPDIHDNLKLAVKCAFGDPGDYVRGGLKSIVGPVPIAYAQDDSRPKKWVNLWKDIVQNDTLTIKYMEDEENKM